MNSASIRKKGVKTHESGAERCQKTTSQACTRKHTSRFAHFDIILFRIRVLTKAQTADPRRRMCECKVKLASALPNASRLFSSVLGVKMIHFQCHNSCFLRFNLVLFFVQLGSFFSRVSAQIFSLLRTSQRYYIPEPPFRVASVYAHCFHRFT